MDIKEYWSIVIVLAAGGLLALALIVLGPWTARAAGPWYVAPGGDDGNTCTTPISPCASINGAISKAVYGDTIYVGTGTYTGTGSRVVSLDASVTLSGGWDDGFTTQSGTSVIDGEASRRGIFVYSGRVVTVERFVIQNGFDSSGRGGGIHNYQGTLTLNNSVVSGGTGKGIFNEGGTVTLNDSAVNGHPYGISNGGTMTLNNSTVSSNMGTGIYNGDTLTLTNTTVSSNMNGIQNKWDGTTTLNNCTITGNAGTGIHNESSITGVTLQNTIVADNTADCSGALGSSGYNLIGNTSGCPFTPGIGDLTDVSANLGQLIGPTGAPAYHPLLPGSPAIDTGNPGGCTGSAGLLTTDQRGAARVGRCDIGAYEYTTPGPAASIHAFGGTPQRTPPLGAFEIPIQATVLDSIGSPVYSATVTFSAPASGVGGTFMDTGSFTTTAMTNESGVATAATLIANELLGSYTVTATVGSVVTPANFLLTNVAWYVTPDGDDGNDCQTSTTPCVTVNGALAKAGFTAGDTVLVSTGTYTGTGSEVVLLNKDAALSGGWDSSFDARTGVSTINGENARRGITVNNSVTSIIERFIIQNGYSDQGGGIHNSVGFLTLISCTVEGNSATSFGGGIQSIGGTLTVESSVISGNTASEYSGGAGIRANSAVTLNNVTVSGNIGYSSISNSDTMTLTNSTVSGNLGRGIDNGGTLILNSSTISDNTETDGDGAGIGNGGTLILNNTTVSGNTAANGRGGGIENDDGTLTLNSSTISGNTAANGCSGGGVYNHGSYASMTLKNTILAENVGGACSDCSSSAAFFSAGHNLIGDTYGCDFTPGPGDLLDVEAKLRPLEGSPGHHPLRPDSPAINAGNPDGCTDHLDNPLITDQRGAPRVGRCDIGAYEAGLAATKQVNGTFDPGGSLTYIITLSNDEGSIDLTDVSVVDTLPPYLTYVEGSFFASSGTGDESGGIVTWAGTVFADTDVTISFSTIISDQIISCTVIANTAVINHGGSYEFERQVIDTTLCDICGLAKEANNPILSAGASGSWDDDDVWGPSVLKEGSAYKMWYTGDDGSNPSQIGLATSTDGIAWTKDAANPVLSPSAVWETGGIAAGNVISDSGFYEMWYTGYDSSGIARVGYATSPDGVAWTKYGGNPVLDVGIPGSWEDDDVRGPAVIKRGNVYHMWYAGHDGITHRIGHATSGDGTNWTKDPANPVLDIGPPGAWDWLDVYAPNVIAYGEVYLLWYSGGTLPEAWQTGYARSPDGNSWTRKEMLIPEGAPGAFDANSADYPSVIADGAEFKVWYSGLDDSGTHNIGHASAEICGPGTPPSDLVYLPLAMRSVAAGYPCPPYYTDDFSDPGSGWYVDDNSDRRYAYTGGQYQIWLKKPSWGVLVTPGAKATDFAVEVRARRTSGSYGTYGIVFGINEDWSERYQVHVDANYYSIWRHNNGNWTALRNWTPSGYINTGTGWNRLRVVRDGATIALYVNDHHLTTVTDANFTGLRRIGLLAYSPTSSPLDARFDDFSLSPASCDGSAAASTGYGESVTAPGFEMGIPGIHTADVPPGGPRPPKRNRGRGAELR